MSQPYRLIFEAYHAASPPPTLRTEVRARIVADTAGHLHTLNLVIGRGNFRVAATWRGRGKLDYQRGDGVSSEAATELFCR